MIISLAGNPGSGGIQVKILAENDEELAKLLVIESVLKNKQLSLVPDPEAGEVNAHTKVLILVSARMEMKVEKAISL